MAKHTNDAGMFSNGKLYQRMVEEIQDYAIILLNKDGIIQNWNKGAQKIKQYAAEEVIGKHFSIFYQEEDIASNLPRYLLGQARDSGRAVQEGWRKRKDGSRFWGSITITALHDSTGNVIGFGKVTRDLTDKKLAEDKLKMSEERYHKMIAEVQDYAIILLSPEGVIENWNAGAENIKGYKAYEVVGKKFELFYTQPDRENHLPDKLLGLAREKGKASQEGWRVRKDGTYFWGSITITALHSKNNEVIGFSKVTRDLTHQKLAEDKLAAYTSELEFRNSELEQFAYVASHDLQEPIRKIQTFAALIKENYDDRAFVENYMDKLDASAKRMVELIKSLLNYSRLSKDKNAAANVKVDLNTIAAEAMQDFELLIEEKKAVITYEHLPVVTGNHVQFGQLFSNLIGNALKFSSAAPIIDISCEIVHRGQIANCPNSLLNNRYYQLRFQDNGIGFEERYSKIIFSLFQRLHKKNEYTGTGIGLALCKKIVENHQGYITASGEPGKGAAFLVYLPYPDSSKVKGEPSFQKD